MCDNCKQNVEERKVISEEANIGTPVIVGSDGTVFINADLIEIRMSDNIQSETMKALLSGDQSMMDFLTGYAEGSDLITRLANLGRSEDNQRQTYADAQAKVQNMTKEEINSGMADLLAAQGVSLSDLPGLNEPVEPVKNDDDESPGYGLYL